MKRVLLLTTSAISSITASGRNRFARPRRSRPVQWWQSESNGIATGTEGRAVYRIGNSADLVSFHWDNPFAGTNFYEQAISGPYGIYFSGGKGNNTETVYSIIPDTRIAVPRYLPSRNGFHFPNNWPSIHITSITLPDPFGDIAVGNASWGLCGGMSFASRDYFEAGIGAPLQRANPTGEGDPLFDYIVRRLAQSLNLNDIADFVKFSDPVYPDTDDPTLGDGRNWMMAHVAWPQIRNVINGGHPCPIGIVIGNLPDVTHIGHQVCAYAYQLRNQVLTLWVYDPNSPDRDDITISLDISRTDQRLFDVRSDVNVGHRIICFFTQSYEQRAPYVPPDLQQHILYRGTDAAIDHIFWDFAQNKLFFDQWTSRTNAPAAAGHPAAMVTPNQQHIFYRGTDGAINHIFYDSVANNLFFDQWTSRTNAPLTAGDPATMVTPNQQHVFYRGTDGAINRIFYDSVPNKLFFDQWTSRTNAPHAAGDPATMVTANQQHIFYRSTDGAINHIFYDSVPNKLFFDQWTSRTNAPLAAGDPATMVTTNQQHVFYRGTDGAINHIFYDSVPNKLFFDQWTSRTNAPHAAGDPATMVTASQQHIFYRGTDGAINHIFYD
jgi:hypothetical protein